MKTMIAVLFLCSVAGLPVASAQQSSNHCDEAKKQCVLSVTGAAIAVPAVQRSSATFNIEAYRPKTFTIVDGSKKILEINTDTGEVTYGAGVTVTEASRKFYEEVGKLFGNKPCAAKAGVDSEALGKPDSEKPEKKLP